MKALTPILLIVVSVALFFFQVNPKWQEIKLLKAEARQYDEALKVAEELKVLRSELQTKLDDFPKEDLTKLERFLPGNFDTIRLTLDVSSLAAKRGIQIKGIKTAEDTSVSTEQFSQNQTKQYNKGTLSFSILTSYQNALLFMEDIERSLRLVDITKVSLSPADNGQYTFSMELQTYWITPRR